VIADVTEWSIKESLLVLSWYTYGVMVTDLKGQVAEDIEYSISPPTPSITFTLLDVRHLVMVLSRGVGKFDALKPDSGIQCQERVKQPETR